jgi:hypothetical protein
MSAIIIGMGGAISVVCSQVAVQASVPRSDVAAVSSLLTLWSELGRGIGYAVSGAIWTNGLPKNLSKRLGDLVPASEIPLIFGPSLRSLYPSDLTKANLCSCLIRLPFRLDNLHPRDLRVWNPSPRGNHHCLHRDPVAAHDHRCRHRYVILSCSRVAILPSLDRSS